MKKSESFNRALSEEAQGWLLLAEAVDSWGRSREGRGFAFLCWWLDHVGRFERKRFRGANESLRQRMLARLTPHFAESHSPHRPFDRLDEDAVALDRVGFCLLLSCECDDEAKSLSGEDEASASLGMKKV